MTALTKKPIMLFHFDNSSSFFDSTNDILPVCKDLQNSNSVIVSSPSKFGKAVHIPNNGQILSNKFDLDTSKDFTISYYQDVSHTQNDGENIFSLNNYNGGLQLSTNGGYVYIHAGNGAGSWDLINGYKAFAITSGMIHFEFDYVASTKTFYFFKDGTLINSWIFAHPLPALMNLIGTTQMIIQPGGKDTYVDEFMMTQEALHTANFTVPTEPYAYGTTFLVKTSDGHYHSYKTGAWVDLGIPTDNAALVSLFNTNGQYDCPTNASIIALDSTAKRCCYQSASGSALFNASIVSAPKKAQLVLEKSDIDLKDASGIA